MRYTDPMEYFLIVFVITGTILVLFFIGVGTGQITIVKDYYVELEQCELNLENIQPFCPACEYKSDVSLSIWLLIVGIIIGVGFHKLWTKYQNEKQKKVKKK